MDKDIYDTFRRILIIWVIELMDEYLNIYVARLLFITRSLKTVFYNLVLLGLVLELS